MELLIVIVVIAILAAVTIVAYNGVQRSALASMMKDTLSKAAQAMEVAAVQGSAYTSFPATVKPPQSIGLGLTSVSDDSTFCINATTVKEAGLAFHLQKGGSPAEGLCEGEVLIASIIGDYNTNAGGGETRTPVSAAVALHSAEGDFHLQTDETWGTFHFSWTPISGATKYEVQTRQITTSTWYYRLKTTGSGNITSTGYTDYSGNIPASTTELSWTSSSVKPTTTIGHEYRWRSVVGGVASEWQTISLVPKPMAELTTVSNFKATATNNWDSVVLTWDQMKGYNNIPAPVIEIQTRNSSGTTWYYRKKADGSGQQTSTSYADYSYDISEDTTSVTWTSANALPANASNNHEYRIRLRSTVVSGMVSDWVTTAISPPTISDMDKLSSLTVTPTNDWSAMTLAWNVGDISKLPDPKIEIQTRNGTSSWAYRIKDDGSGSQPNTNYPNYSYDIPPSTHSITWTSNNIKPSSGGVTHEYRIRLTSTRIPSVVGPWVTVGVTPPATENIATVQNFQVIPAGDWSSVTLSWNEYQPTLLASPTYEIQTRTSGGTWYYRQKADGSGNQTSTNYTGYSYDIPLSTTSLNWTSATARPSGAGVSHEYRIRVKSNATPTGMYSPWATVTVTR